MPGVGCDGVERAVRADVLRLVDVKLKRPLGSALSRDQRFDVEIFARKHLQVVERPRHDSANDYGTDVGFGEAFELEQLVQPDRILVGRAPRVGGDPPARLDLAAVDQREDEVRIAGIDRKQHAAPLGEERQSAKRQAVAAATC